MQHLLEELQTGLEAMGIRLPAGASEKMVDFIGLLGHWNRAFNLTAIRDPEAMVSLHLLDSLAVIPYIRGPEVLDVGSGAGLPGIPLALALPQLHFTLLDSNGKKTRFLTQAKITLALQNVEVVNQRVEDYRAGIYFNDIIARAFASSEDIVKNTAHLQDARTRILVMQGRRDERISAPGYRVSAVHALQVPGLGAERHLLEITRT